MVARVIVSNATLDISTEDNGDLLVGIKLPKEMNLAYLAVYQIQVSQTLRAALSSLDLTSWSFTTENPPEATAATTKIQVDKISVYGVGVYMLDVGDIDFRKGQFSADLQLYLLKYYLEFDDPETARREAMNENRTCRDATHGDKFEFIKIKDPEVLRTFLNFINSVGVPEMEIVSSQSLLDHYRLRHSFVFSPNLESYPFNLQILPIKLELAGQSVSPQPSALLCTLETFTGFAKDLSSLDRAGLGHSIYTGSFEVDEYLNWPPLKGKFKMPFRFPHDASVSRQPTRKSSRLTWRVHVHRPRIIGVLELAPALFIALSALVSYFLPDLKTRISTCTTALLAAVVQHSAMRSRVPERSSITNADLVMLVVYSLISLATISAVVVSFATHHRALAWHADAINFNLRIMGLLSPFLFGVFVLDPRDIYMWLMTIVMIIVGTYMLGRMKYKFSNSNGNGYKSVNQNATDVASWVESLDLPNVSELEQKNYADAFYLHRIDGYALGMLDVAMIKSLGIPLGVAVRIHQQSRINQEENDNLNQEVELVPIK